MFVALHECFVPCVLMHECVCVCASVPPSSDCFNGLCEVMRDMTSLFSKAIQIMMMYAYHILCALCLLVQFYKG